MNESSDSMNALLAKRQRQAETVRKWFAERPGYQAAYDARRKADRDEQGWSAKDGTLRPVQRVNNKLPYSITVTKPLASDERVSPRHVILKSGSVSKRKKKEEYIDERFINYNPHGT